jgi:hypothetical protein
LGAREAGSAEPSGGGRRGPRGRARRAGGWQALSLEGHEGSVVQADSELPERSSGVHGGSTGVHEGSTPGSISRGPLKALARSGVRAKTAQGVHQGVKSVRRCHNPWGSWWTPRAPRPPGRLAPAGARGPPPACQPPARHAPDRWRIGGPRPPPRDEDRRPVRARQPGAVLRPQAVTARPWARWHLVEGAPYQPWHAGTPGGKAPQAPLALGLPALGQRATGVPGGTVRVTATAPGRCRRGRVYLRNFLRCAGASPALPMVRPRI